jgi:hypothetical protein
MKEAAVHCELQPPFVIVIIHRLYAAFGADAFDYQMMECVVLLLGDFPINPNGSRRWAIRRRGCGIWSRRLPE